MFFGILKAFPHCLLTCKVAVKSGAILISSTSLPPIPWSLETENLLLSGVTKTLKYSLIPVFIHFIVHIVGASKLEMHVLQPPLFSLF